MAHLPGTFLQGDGTALPFPRATFDLAWVPIMHRIEPALKRWKDRWTGEWP